ncbi:hypothetical protein [Prosthecobacter sp.]|uniref:hypothetical protein n=1 Tax=Prosthecobacter sp. TaxID=1965333 RepID=UPI002ABBA9FF|nr:hypothetical protein [Prosthecobacter sp.]MDZ4401750.1 hypothetical protein [Prosthecobacter sp.]
MKIKLHTLAFALIASSAVLAADVTTKTTTVKADGSTETTIKTTTGTGTLTEYIPGTTFILKEVTGPVTYLYGKTVAYVTKSGKVITQDMLNTRIRVGSPVSVQYVTDGNNRVISRVVVDD